MEKKKNWGLASFSHSEVRHENATAQTRLNILNKQQQKIPLKHSRTVGHENFCRPPKTSDLEQWSEEPYIF